MRVVEYDIVNVPPRWTLLKVVTSDGHVGWGEPTLSHRSRAVHGAVADLMDQYIVGNSPLRIEKRWQEMYRGGFYRGGPVLMSAIAGIDQALWDIKGRHYGAPVHELLGGRVRDRIKVYQHAIAKTEATRTTDEIADNAREQVDAGFRALKMTPTKKLERVDSPARTDEAVSRVESVRAAVGNEVDIAIDFHGRVSKPMAKRLTRKLELYDPMFYEEPVLVEHNDLMANIESQTSVPLATGERMHSRWEFADLFDSGGIDVAQPDVSHAGGISETRRIASMAEAHDVALAPHCPLGPIALASCLQVDGCSQNALIQEQVVHLQNRFDVDPLSYVEDPSVFALDADGYVAIPTEPGLGIEIDDERVKAAEWDENKWEPPLWHHDDGSVAER